MRDQNDRISKFIKNRLQSDRDTNEGWDKPDLSVWEKAKAQVTLSPKSKKTNALIWIYWFGLSILLLASLFYNWHLINIINEAKLQSEEQSQKVADLETRLSNELKIQQTLADQNIQFIDELQQTNLNLQEENAQIIKKRKQSLRYSKGLHKTEYVANTENRSLNTEQAPNYLANENLHLSNFLSEFHATDLVALLPISPNPQFLQSDLVPVNLSINQSQISSIQMKKRRSLFEIGLNYGLSNLNIPSAIKLNKQEESLEETNEVAASTCSLQFAYSLKKNWWLKSGLRYSNYLYTNAFQFKTEYDKTKEYKKSDGSLVNEFSLRTSNGYFQTSQSIEVNITDDKELKKGDFIFGEFVESQRISSWQIPIGVEYRQRIKKFGWQIEACVLMNMMAFSDTKIEGLVQSTQKELQTKIIKKQYDSATSKFLLGAQAGIGVHYKLSTQLLLRADVLVQYNTYYFNQDIQFGLGYQF